MHAVQEAVKKHAGLEYPDTDQQAACLSRMLAMHLIESIMYHACCARSLCCGCCRSYAAETTAGMPVCTPLSYATNACYIYQGRAISNNLHCIHMHIRTPHVRVC